MALPVYNQRVKHLKRYLSWLIIAITLPVLGVLAMNQFNWLQELRNREQLRIEYSMASSAQALSKRLKEELFFLPSLMRMRQEDQAELPAVLAERFEFWRYYALFPSMVSRVYLIEKTGRTIAELRSNRLMPPTLISDHTVIADRSIIDTPDELQMIMPIYGSKESRRLLLCVFDKDILFRDVVPAIAAASLESTDLYRYRIVDTRAGTVVFQSEDGTGDSALALPDLEVPLFEPLYMPSFQQLPDFLTRHLPTNYAEKFPFIKERLKTEAAEEKDDTPPQLFPYLVLQVMNKDGSLAELSRKATIQNALISFGTVILLTMVMIVLAEGTRRARTLSLSQREFIATITHELKTPLSVISSAAQNLSDGLIKDQKKAEQYGAVIKQEASRLAVSIEHFLLYSNTQTLNRTKPSLCDIAELIDAGLRFTSDERLRLNFRTEVQLPEEPVFILGDRVALESVFQNLAQNVLRHANSGKFLGIIVSLKEGTRRDPRRSVLIQIRDKGPGIPSRELKAIFGPFVRGRRAVEHQIPGNGIGLNLVRRIVLMHGGTIKVESKLEGGSAFTVILPESKGDDDARQNFDDRG